MIKHTTLIIAICISTILIGQNNQVSLSPGYANQSFYSMQNGEIINISNEDWDIAFSTDAFSATIRINDGKGVELYTYPLGDTSSWTTINNSSINILTNPMYNSDTKWSSGAFDTNQVGGFDYGWGIYNLQNHHIVGDSLFIIKTVNGTWKKLWMERKSSGAYIFKYANLDGTNEISDNILASNYDNKLFIYYSLDNNILLDREPPLSNWDITFTKYITEVQSTPYSVTGVLSNEGIEVAQADGLQNPLSYTNYSSHVFQTDINTIGYDWKTFQGSYILDPERCFFIRDYDQNIWRLFFTNFDGMSTGNIEFNTELITSTNISETEKQSTLTVYPNPVSSGQEITLIHELLSSNKSEANIVLHDISGREVYKSSILTRNGLNAHKIATEKINKGIYIISLNIDGWEKTERIVIY